MALDVRWAAELSENVLRKDLAELNTHLVVRVDTPDSTLDVDLVLVQGDEGTKGTRGELLEHDRVGGLVALEDLGLDESGVGGLGTELVLDLLLGLAEGEGLGLSEEVGEKDLVVLAARDGVEGLNRGEEVTNVNLGCSCKEQVLTMGSTWCPGE